MQLGWIGVGDRAEGPWLSLEWLLSQSRIPVGFHNQNSPPASVSQDEPKVHQRHFSLAQKQLDTICEGDWGVSLVEEVVEEM